MLKRRHIEEILEANERIKKHDPLFVDQVIDIYLGPKNPSYVFLVNEEPILCGGILDQGFRNGQAWILFTDDFYKYKFSCHKVMVNMLLLLSKRMKLKRLEVHLDCAIASKINKKWVRKFGFKPEGISRGIGLSGENHLRFARKF
jgi:hypothetical protein